MTLTREQIVATLQAFSGPTARAAADMLEADARLKAELVTANAELTWRRTERDSRTTLLAEREALIEDAVAGLESVFPLDGEFEDGEPDDKLVDWEIIVGDYRASRNLITRLKAALTQEKPRG